VARERVVLEHPVERGGEFFLRHRHATSAPRARFVAISVLTHAADRSRAEHRLDPLDHDRQFDAAQAGDLSKRLGWKPWSLSSETARSAR
jgi:hypothetical protein